MSPVTVLSKGEIRDFPLFILVFVVRAELASSARFLIYLVGTGSLLERVQWLFHLFLCSGCVFVVVSKLSRDRGSCDPAIGRSDWSRGVMSPRLAVESKFLLYLWKGILLRNKNIKIRHIHRRSETRSPETRSPICLSDR